MDVVLFLLRILIVVVLYAFLGVVLWALLRDQAPLAQPAIPASRLTQLADNDGESNQASGRHYAIQSAAWIGRDPNCLVRTDDEFTSARHAQVLWGPEERGWWIEDNLSRNGTFVNGERITRAMLKEGDVIRVGRMRFRFENRDSG